MTHEFRLWAPEATTAAVHLGGDNGGDHGAGGDHGGGTVVELSPAGDGWWAVIDPDAGPGTDYRFSVDGARPCPDPRSRWQPAGVHGPSRLYDDARFTWSDRRWTGRQLAGSVLYELHIATFTRAGTFDAAVGRLDHLVDLGVDLVELLPVAAFNGDRGWGYDGVCWFAPHEPYGGPDGLKRFVDACHSRGLGVVLDVVYNHFGPSGAYAPRLAPYLTTAENPWGRSINLDGPHADGVRQYIIDSAVRWLRDFHVDGLRLDAVHALVDHGATHLLEELASTVEALSTELGRPLTLVAESDLNDPRLITAREAGGYGLHAQWDDDAHHVLHAMLTGERQGYYTDFGSPESFAAVWTAAFWHAGTWSPFRKRIHGRPVDRNRTPGYRFLAYLQNHDQIGNRAAGDRLPATLSAGLLKVGATLLFTAPFTPMVFMGEEWAATTPWQFFASHPEPELAEAVVTGRRREFEAHGWPAGAVPNPQEPATFLRSTVDWSELDQPEHAAMLAIYRQLIAVRKSHGDLADPRLHLVEVWHGEQWVAVRRGRFVVAANLSQTQQHVPTRGTPTGLLFGTEPDVALGGAGVRLPGEAAAIVAVRR